MITEQELKNKVKIISQDAWKIGTHTTLNDMVEYIVRESMMVLLEAFKETQNYIDLLISELEEKNVSKNGRVSQPKRNTKAPIAGTRSIGAEAR